MVPDQVRDGTAVPSRGRAGSSTSARIEELERTEAELMDKLIHCVPPVDLHRRELERVRSELQALRDSGTGRGNAIT